MGADMGGWIGQLGGWAGMVGLTGWLFWMLATGRLYTRSQHESIVKLHEARNVTLIETNRELLAQNNTLLEGTTTTKEFFEKVPVVRKPRTRQKQEEAQ